MIDLSFWFMFPVALVIATMAMLAGIGGALLFSPFFMLVLGLDPRLALAAGLFIEVFGFSSGLVGYVRKGSVSWPIVKRLLIFTLPLTFLGVLLSHVFPSVFLRVVLGLLLASLSWNLLVSRHTCTPKDPRCTGVCPATSRAVSGGKLFLFGFGALLLGTISSGLGEINEYVFLKGMRLPVPVASGTSVVLVALNALIGVLAHVYYFPWGVVGSVVPLLVFAVPGVILGAQVGVWLSSLVNQSVMSRFIGGLFGFVALVTLVAVL